MTKLIAAIFVTLLGLCASADNRQETLLTYKVTKFSNKQCSGQVGTKICNVCFSYTGRGNWSAREKCTPWNLKCLTSGHVFSVKNFLVAEQIPGEGKVSDLQEQAREIVNKCGSGGQNGNLVSKIFNGSDIKVCEFALRQPIDWIDDVIKMGVADVPYGIFSLERIEHVGPRISGTTWEFLSISIDPKNKELCESY